MRSFITCSYQQIFYDDKIKACEVAVYVARMGEIKNGYKILVEKPERKTSQGTRRRSLEDNIRMDCGEKEWEGDDWMHLAQDRDQWRALVSTIMNPLVLGLLSDC
jgi:hypothetical protein